MKTLFLARHAKSSWIDIGLSDIDRPLKERGVLDAYKMGSYLRQQGMVPSVFITSPAVRAFHTAIIYARQLDFHLDCLSIDQRIYSGASAGVIQVAQQVDDSHDSVMLFGHNPTFTSLINNLSNGAIENLPTSGIAAISFAISSWADLGSKPGKLDHFLHPKLLSKP